MLIVIKEEVLCQIALMEVADKEVADKEVKDPIAWRQAEIQYPSLMVSVKWTVGLYFYLLYAYKAVASCKSMKNSPM